MTTPDIAISAQEVTGASKAALLHAAGMTRGAIAELVSILDVPQAPRNAWLMLFELYRFEAQQGEHDALAVRFLRAHGEEAPAFMPFPGFVVPGVLRLEARRFAMADLAAIRGHAQGRATVAVDIAAVECLPIDLAIGVLGFARELRAKGQRLLLMRATACVAALLDALHHGEGRVVAVRPAAPERTSARALEALAT